MSDSIKIHEYLSAIGKKGGKSKSEAKSASSKINVAKALAARMKKVENKTLHKRLTV
jgi:hypothetical protein